MAVLFQSPDLQLPWSSSRRENQRFNVIAAIALVLCLVMGVFIQVQDRPVLDQTAKEKIPDSLAKIMERKKKEPPKVKPKPKVKAKEKKPEEKKPEEKKPKPKKKEPPKPKTEKQKEAREKLKKKFKKNAEALNKMKSLMPKVAASKALSKGNKKTVVNRKVLTGKAATATSGGIQTAAIPTSTGVGKGLEGRSVLQVSDGSLGGTAVDTTGGVDDATGGASQGVAGQRSEEQIRRVFDASKGALYSIYNRALRKDPTLQGKVTFEITIEPDGSVSAARIVSSELNNPSLERRLISKMRQIDFGAADVSTMKTRWAIDFLPF